MSVAYHEGDVDSSGAQEVNLRTAAGAELLGQQVSATSLPVVISSDQPEFPVKSSEQQLASDSKVFSVTGTLTGVGTSVTTPLYFKNPTGSGKTAKLISLVLNNSTTVRSAIFFNIAYTPTVSANGTALTISSTVVGSGVTSGMNAYTLPTVTAGGTISARFMVGHSLVTTSLYIPLNSIILVPENNAFLLTASGDAASRSLHFTLTWAEV